MAQDTGDAATAPREPSITVIVNSSVEAIDFDAWAQRYVAAVLAADKKTQHQSEAA
jgi:hypothetical protein